MSDDRGGYAAPRGAGGVASLHGPAPWTFSGRSLTVLARCRAAGVAALLPPGLSARGEPIVRFSAHWLRCDLGLGPDLPGNEPERAQFHEAVVGIAAESRDGVLGYWDPFLWCDGDAEIAVGREMYGWPQRAGTIAMTMPHPIHGFRPGDRASARVSRLGHPVFSLSIDLAAEGPLVTAAPAFSTFFTERILPDPVTGATTRELYASAMRDVVIATPLHGPARLTLAAPELAGLEVLEVLGGQAHAVAWVKDRARLLLRETD